MPGGEGLRPTTPETGQGQREWGESRREARCCERSPRSREVPAEGAEQELPHGSDSPGPRPAADKGAAGSTHSLTTRSWRRPPARCSCRGARRRGPASARSWWAARAAPAEPAAGTGRPADKSRGEALERGLRAAGARRAQPGCRPLPPRRTLPRPPPPGGSEGGGAPAARPLPRGRGRAKAGPPPEPPRAARGERTDGGAVLALAGVGRASRSLRAVPGSAAFDARPGAAVPGAPRPQVCGERRGTSKRCLCNAQAAGKCAAPSPKPLPKGPTPRPQPRAPGGGSARLGRANSDQRR